MYGSGVSVKCVQFRQLVRASRVLYIELDAKSNKAGPVLNTGNWETSKLKVKVPHIALTDSKFTARQFLEAIP